MRPRDVKVGDHIEHDPSGDYLGVVTTLMKSGVRVDGPRMRDGEPVTFATYDEIRPATAPGA